MTNRMAHILLVEDDEKDIVLAQKAFESFKVPKQMHVARDGEIALDMLYKRGDHKDSPDFDLILLDLNLPGINGPEVLQDIKQQKKLASIPVVMLSSSKNQADIMKSYNYQANSYIVKANGIKEFQRIAQAVEICWFRALSDDDEV